MRVICPDCGATVIQYMLTGSLYESPDVIHSCIRFLKSRIDTLALSIAKLQEK